MPSADDLRSLAKNGCELGIIAVHDGSLFTFRKVSEPFPGHNVTQNELDRICLLTASHGEAGMFGAVERYLGFKIERVS